MPKAAAAARYGTQMVEASRVVLVLLLLFLVGGWENSGGRGVANVNIADSKTFHDSLNCLDGDNDLA